MLEKLSDILKTTTNRIANAIFLDKHLVESIIKDLQRALIEADVNIQLVKEISDELKKAAFDERVKEIDKREHLIKILHDKLLEILGEKKKIEVGKKQERIIFLGLYGAGKTTTIAKLGNYYSKRGKKVALVGLDVHRPAAKEQLKQLAEKNRIDYFIDEKENNALKTWENFESKLKKYELILIDTAGRHSLDKELIKEIKDLQKQIKPTQSILVMPADIGQTAKKQSAEFKEAVNISGVIITRMDSTAKAGGALTACAEIKARVYFIGTGEKINDIEEFNPETFLSRLLGMGDLQALIEKVKSVTDEKKQAKIQNKIAEGKIDLEDVIEQVKSMSEIGGFDKIKSMIPGMNNAKIPDKAIETQEKKIAKWEHILKSMTYQEKNNPELLKDKKTGTSRINRIAKGAGVNNSDIKSLLKQYDMLKEMVKSQSDLDLSKGFDQKQLQKMMKKFGKKKVMRFK